MQSSCVESALVADSADELTDQCRSDQHPGTDVTSLSDMVDVQLIATPMHDDASPPTGRPQGAPVATNN